MKDVSSNQERKCGTMRNSFIQSQSESLLDPSMGIQQSESRASIDEDPQKLKLQRKTL